jgi:hypothetical protein
MDDLGRCLRTREADIVIWQDLDFWEDHHFVANSLFMEATDGSSVVTFAANCRVSTTREGASPPLLAALTAFRCFKLIRHRLFPPLRQAALPMISAAARI